MTGKKGYADYSERIPPGWRVVQSERWPVNNPGATNATTKFEVSKWRLRTYGDVGNPLELTYEQFRSLPHVTKVLDHHCIDGWSYLGQRWSGVDISLIREATRVRPSARYMMIESDRGASQRFPISQDILLADSQDGVSLAGSIGYPVRVVAPGAFGYKSRKWVDRIRFCSASEMDGLEQSFANAGAYEIYSTAIAEADPWTVDDLARKKFLRTVFAADTEEKRQENRRRHLLEEREGGPYQKIVPSPNDDQEVELCKLDILERSGRLQVVVNGYEILLLKFGDRIYGVEPICSHMGTDLSHGKLNENAGTIRCPLHGALFDASSGVCLSGSMGSDGGAFPPIRTYRVRRKEDSLFLERMQDWGAVW